MAVTHATLAKKKLQISLRLLMAGLAEKLVTELISRIDSIAATTPNGHEEHTATSIRHKTATHCSRV